jgi:hypothetical protein
LHGPDDRQRACCFSLPESAIWHLDEGAQTKVLSLLARSLGRVMPFWYALCLVLLLVEAYIHRGESSFHFLLAAIVPINKRITSSHLHFL